jgi:YVTN family beta-propeller protein
MHRNNAASLLLSALLVLSGAGRAVAQTAYEHFESPQVHPARLTPDGTKLLVTNTADSRLSVFSLSSPQSPTLLAEIPVGLEPVSVNARTNDEVWVVNHVSDSISIVSLSQGLVVDTLQVGDEPADVVFAGSPQRAFVSVARRNEVRVYDPVTRALVKTIALQGEHPRALAVSPSGGSVYAAFALSGNRTTIIPASLAPAQPAPTNTSLPPAPDSGLIVDATDPNWSSAIRYTMPDNDVVEINAGTQTVTRYFSRVGTVNLGLAVHPTTGALYVANTDARNLVRFEPTLRGHIVDNRVTRITTGSTPSITPVELNPGLDYSVLPNATAKSTALAQPTDILVEPSGASAWVAAFGTDRVARIDTATGNVVARVEVGPSTGATVNPRTKRGPRGLALHAASGSLYVVNRISNTLSVVNTSTAAVVREVAVGFDPSPTVIRQGRGFLYDAKLSGNGTASCASCHIDADLDQLAWDLGNPGGSMQTVVDPNTGTFSLHPMKGPMTTQTLKGVKGQNPLHWRGDKASFNDFNGAFAALMGGSQLASADMQAYTDFINTVRLAPNPHRNRDDTLPASFGGGDPRAGENTFLTEQFRSGVTCNGCHTATAGGTNRTLIPANALQEPQDMKTAHLRNLYQKNNFRKTVGGTSLGGFGFTHDGAIATLDEFLAQPVFGTFSTDPTRRANLTAYLLCFPTGMAPAVGYSYTVSSANANSTAVSSGVALVEAQARAGKIDLIIKGKVNGVVRGLYYNPLTRVYDVDAAGASSMTWSQLQASAAAGTSLFTMMGVPPGTGVRMGIDRDADGVLDANE